MRRNREDNTGLFTDFEIWGFELFTFIFKINYVHHSKFKIHIYRY